MSPAASADAPLPLLNDEEAEKALLREQEQDHVVASGEFAAPAFPKPVHKRGNGRERLRSFSRLRRVRQPDR